jgi:hypothetical protein
MATLCLVLAGLLGTARLLWDAAAAQGFAALASRVAHERAAERPLEAIDCLSRQGASYPWSNFAAAAAVLEEATVADLLEGGRRGFREAARLEAEGRLGDAYRLYGDLERLFPSGSIRSFAERSRSGITRSREAAETLLGAARGLESRGELQSAWAASLRVLLEHPGSSAAHDLKVPLRVETEPPGAHLSVAGRGRLEAPAWIHWPVRPGVKLRVSKPGFRPRELTGLVGPGPALEDGWRVSVRLEPEPLWELPQAGGMFLGGGAGGGEPALVAGADGVLRMIEIAKGADGPKGRIVWERPLEAVSSSPLRAHGFVLAGAIRLTLPAGGGTRGFRLEDGADLPASDPRLELLDRALSPLPAEEIEDRAASAEGALFTLLPGGVLERRDLPAGGLAFRAERGGGLERISTGREGFLLSGRGGRLVVVDRRTGEVVREAWLTLPAGRTEIDEIIPLESLAGAGERTAPPDFGALAVGGEPGSQTLFHLGPAGEIRWRIETGLPRGLSLRILGAAGPERRLLLSGPGFGVVALPLPAERACGGGQGR